MPKTPRSSPRAPRRGSAPAPTGDYMRIDELAARLQLQPHFSPVRLGRRFVSCGTDAECVEKATARLAQLKE